MPMTPTMTAEVGTSAAIGGESTVMASMGPAGTGPFGVSLPKCIRVFAALPVNCYSINVLIRV